MLEYLIDLGHVASSLKGWNKVIAEEYFRERKGDKAIQSNSTLGTLALSSVELLVW